MDPKMGICLRNRSVTDVWCLLIFCLNIFLYFILNWCFEVTPVIFFRSLYNFHRFCKHILIFNFLWFFLYLYVAPFFLRGLLLNFRSCNNSISPIILLIVITLFHNNLLLNLFFIFGCFYWWCNIIIHEIV